MANLFRRPAALISSLTGVVMVLAACGTSQDAKSGQPQPTPSTITTAATATAAVSTPATVAAAKSPSPRGNTVKAVGELSGIGYPGQPDKVSWTVTNIQVDAPCTGKSSKPAENGHFVVLAIEAQTGADFLEEQLRGGFAPGLNWQLIDADGVTQPSVTSDASYSCISSEWPDPLRPGSKYRFRIVLDSRSTTGVITFVPSDRNGQGWEWSF